MTANYSPEQKVVLRAQRLICATAVVLLAIKLIAWYITGSVAVLTDALESIVNVITGFFGLYSLVLSYHPRDENHPYGHGKIEFLSAAVEGILIFMAGGIIIYEAILNLQTPHEIVKLDTGILFIGFSAIINFAVGFYVIRQGRKMRTLPLIASGKHLHSDTWSTVAIVAGLLLIKFTGFRWIDSIVAIAMALFIIYTGIKILRQSLAGIMDETDLKLLEEMVEYLGQNRSDRCIDLHNLRIIKYGSILHVDCHITVPWFINVNEAHAEVSTLESMVRERYGEQVELFVHTDGCLDFSCAICSISDCAERKYPFQQKIKWTVENISRNSKHNSG